MIRFQFPFVLSLSKHRPASLRRAEEEQGFDKLSPDGIGEQVRFSRQGFTPLRRSAENGFTLVELMVSLLVFGLIAGAGAMLLGVSVESQARVSERLDASAQLRRAHALLAADMAQAVSRPTRGGTTGQRPAFAGGGSGPIAALVRGGWDNPGGEPRASLQRVEYRIEAGRLVRLTADALDGGETTRPLVLAEGLTAATARYRAEDGWRDIWDPEDPELLPRAVEITLGFADGRSLVQRFVVAA